MTASGLPALAELDRAAQRRSAFAASLYLVPPVCLVLGVAALRSAKPDDIGSLGLVQALPIWLYAALALLTASFLAAVFFAPVVRAALLAGHVVVFTVLLHGAATIVEPLPRFIPAWFHVGFADYIARTGQTMPELDARFSWPGFFALTGMATRAAGLSDARPLLGWTAVVVNLASAAAVYRLARIWFPDPRASWLAVWLFLPANWVGQDYFSPQAVNDVFYLIILVVVVAWFRPTQLERVRRRVRKRAGHARSAGQRRPPRHGVRLRRMLHLIGLPPAPMLYEPEPVQASPATHTGLMVVVLLLFTAGTVSHQLTPVTIVLSVCVLAAVRRCSVEALPFLLFVIVAGYISYLTVIFWSGHLHDVLGSVGQPGSTVDSGIAARVQGDPGHLLVVQVRQLFTVGVWILAAVGAWRLMRRGRGDFALFGLAAAPFLLVLAQSYGGEVFLRIYAFALPFMVVLMVAMLVPRWPSWHPVVAATLTCVLSLGLTGIFFVARYGNESFERVLPGDAKAVDWLYDNATTGATFVAVTANVPWRFREVEQYQYLPLYDDLGPDRLPAIETAMEANPRGAYLILTRGQYVMAEVFYGVEPGWGERIEQQVIASGRFQRIYSGEGAKIFVLTRVAGVAGESHG